MLTGEFTLRLPAPQLFNTPKLLGLSSYWSLPLDTHQNPDSSVLWGLTWTNIPALGWKEQIRDNLSIPSVLIHTMFHLMKSMSAYSKHLYCSVNLFEVKNKQKCLTLLLLSQNIIHAIAFQTKIRSFIWRLVKFNHVRFSLFRYFHFSQQHLLDFLKLSNQ